MSLIASVSSRNTVFTAGPSSSIDTTGATLLVLALTWETSTSGNECTVSDSAGNTWVSLTLRTQGALRTHLFYVLGPTTSATHTFNAAGTINNSFPTIGVLAFNDNVNMLDSQSGAGTASGTTLQPGSITPVVNNEVFVTALNSSAGSNGALSIDSSFNITFNLGNSATSDNLGLAYKIQTSAGAENPTWTQASGVGVAAMAVFRSSSVPLTGVSATGVAGILAPNISVALTGVSATGAVGNVGVGGRSAALTGVAAAGALGTLSPGTTRALTGVAGVGALGITGSSVTIRVDQTGFEVFGGGPAAARIEQTGFEVFGIPGTPTTIDLPPPSDDPCVVTEPIFWAAIQPSSGLGAVYQGAMTALRDPSIYYGGYKQPSIGSIAAITRAASDYLTGQLPAQTVSVVWADLTHFVRNIFATVRADWNGSGLWVYLVDNATRLLRSTPRLLFYGLIKGDRPTSGLTYTTPARDVVGSTYTLLGNDIQIPKRIFRQADFPGLPAASQGLGVPIIGGHIANGTNGALKIIDLGDFTCQDSVVRRCLGIAGHACNNLDAYQNGVVIPGGDYGFNAWLFGKSGWTTISPSNNPYIEINSQWFSLMFVMGGRAAAYDQNSAAVFVGTISSGTNHETFVLGSGQGAMFRVGDNVIVRRAANSDHNESGIISVISTDTITLAIPTGATHALGDVPVAGDTMRSAYVADPNQTAFVYVDVDGMYTGSAATGSRIDNLLAQDLHNIEQWYIGDYQMGPWLPSPTFPFYPGFTPSPLLDRASWTTAQTVSATYCAGGFKGAFVIGAQGKRRSLQATMADHAVSGNFLRSMHGNNQLFVRMLDRDRARFMAGHKEITDRIHIIGDKVEPVAQIDWLFNDYEYRYAANYRDDSLGDWNGHNIIGNSPSQDDNGVVSRTDVFPMVVDQATADAVAGQRLDFCSSTPMLWSIPQSLCGLSVEVLDGVPVTHYEGTGASGFHQQALWVMKQTIDPATCMVTADAVDVQRLLIDSYTLTVVGGTGSGHYSEGDIIIITASAPTSGHIFDDWTGDTSYLADASSSSTVVTMPAANVTLTAAYSSSAMLYTLIVVNGSGDGNYAFSTFVAVDADAPATGYLFNAWTGDTSYVDHPSLASAHVTMPAAAISITATYAAIPATYHLVVTSGSGDGVYHVGDVVSIVADAPPMGMSFSEWEGETDVIAAVASPSSSTTNVTIFARGATLRVAWNPNADIDDVTGYLVLYGTTSGVYTSSVDVGNVLTTLLTGLVDGTIYYIMVVAHNGLGVYGGYGVETSGVAAALTVTAIYV